jgi:ATP-dependent DNA ligase
VKLPLPLDLAPMEAETADALPAGEGWQYEPKWDGFRCLAFRDGDRVELRSKAGKPLTRYFPEVVESLRALGARRFVVDGEIVVPVQGALSFDQLLLRIHPAESRVRSLAEAHPAHLVAFDLLLAERGGALDGRPLEVRRERLESFAARYFSAGEVHLSPATRELSRARRWLSGGRVGLDGVMAKRLDAPYLAGERSAMVKVKNLRTADCVVGGFRYASRERIVGSLLLGLYDADGLLHHVGFTSGMSTEQRRELTPLLEELAGRGRVPGFTGRAPGGPSRWSTERTSEWVPLPSELVVEVRYDHFSGGRFRHGTGLMRWRPDKAPEQCTLDQIATGERQALRLLEGAGA